MNAGLWRLFQPPQGVGTGAFVVNRNTRHNELMDGLSATLGMSEVKAFTPYWRDGGRPGAANAATPDTPEALAAHFGASEFKSDSGHTEWVDARTHQTGFTTTFTPNTVVRYESGGLPYDVDFNSMREGRSTTTPTYASATSRSYHPGGVNTMMMDGSVRSVANSISLPVWRALGSRAGGEPASPD